MVAQQTSLEDSVRRIAAEFGGRIGLYGRDLRPGRSAEIALDADDLFPTASMIKLPVLLELFRQVEAGQTSLDETIPLRDEDRVGGGGLLRHLSLGLALSVRDHAFLMMSISDNWSTNVLIERVGIDNVNATLDRLGFPRTRLKNRIDFAHVWDDPDHLGVGTPREFAEMMELVHHRRVLSPASCEEMLRAMGGIGADRIGRYLPINAFAAELRERGLLEGPDVRIAGKTGSLIGIRGHTAVVWGDTCDFSLAVMTDGSRDPSFGYDHDGILAIARVGKAVYDYWST